MNELHIDALVLLKAVGETGIPADTLLSDLRRGRHRALTLPALEQALRDLADRSFTLPFQSSLGAKRWSITGRGRRALEEEGL